MATQPTDDSKALFRLIADGEWHSYDDVRDQIALQVPPGRALRKYEERLRGSRAFHQTRNPTPELSEDEKIFFGAKACAQIAISSWVGRGLLKRNDVDGGKFIRIKPGFKSYGIPIETPEDPQKESAAAPKGPDEAEGYPEVHPSDSELPQTRPAPPDEVSERGESQTGAEVTEEPPTRFIDPEPVRRIIATPDGWTVEGMEPIGADDAEPVEEKPSPAVTVLDMVSCDSCGLLVMDPTAHERWHEDQKQAFEQNAMALFDEVALRTLFSDEIGHNLDKFQLGMEQYLNARFEHVERRLEALRTPNWASNRWTDGDVRKDNR